MKLCAVITALAALITALSVACGKGPPAPPTAELESAFRASDPSTKSTVDQARTALEGERYTEAMLALNRAVEQRKASKEQQQAVSRAVGHVMKAVDRDPSLNNPVLHQTMAELIRQVHGEN